MKLEESPVSKDLKVAWPFLVRAINRVNLSQFDGKVITFTSSPTAGNESVIPHGLGRVPIGYIVMRQDKAASIYEFAPADAVNIHLASDKINVNATIVVM